MSHVVRYRVLDEHKAQTVIGTETVEEKDKETGETRQVERDKTVDGSIHHRDLTEFTGLITRSHPDGSHDIVIFPPNRPTVSIDRVTEGDGPGQFQIVSEKPERAKRAAH